MEPPNTEYILMIRWFQMLRTQYSVLVLSALTIQPFRQNTPAVHLNTSKPQFPDNLAVRKDVNTTELHFPSPFASQEINSLCGAAAIAPGKRSLQNTLQVNT